MGSIFNHLTTSLNPLEALLASGPYRPPQWNQKQTATLTMTAPVTGDSASAFAGATTVYIFDAVLRSDHAQEVVFTQNPVQTGAPITDHAYRTPARLVVEILMSDAMQSYTAGQFEGAESRSVAAYQTLLSIQQSITFVQVSTRMRQYSNMLITNIAAPEHAETRYGAMFAVTFTEIINASGQSGNGNVSGGSVSALPQTTDQTSSGQTLLSAVSTAIKVQHAVSTAVGSSGRSLLEFVPGAGAWSSQNVDPPNQTPSATAQVLPLTPAPNQRFSVSLNFSQTSGSGTTQLQMELNYSAVAGFWVMSIFDQTGAAVVSSVPLVTGVYPAANILAPYAHLNIGSAYVINASGTTAADYPNATDLGTDFILVWDQPNAS